MTILLRTLVSQRYLFYLLMIFVTEDVFSQIHSLANLHV